MTLGLLLLSACEARELVPAVAVSKSDVHASIKSKEFTMWMTVGDRRFTVTLADTEAARTFASQLPLSLDMAELNGNEKYADLSKELPTEPIQPGAILSGDLMLYGSKTVVLFYEPFRSSYSYTRLGRVDDPGELARVLGRGTARIAFSQE
ncbi:MAG: cyclophilin-like fold protein [Rhodanobacter sp.]